MGGIGSGGAGFRRASSRASESSSESRDLAFPARTRVIPGTRHPERVEGPCVFGTRRYTARVAPAPYFVYMMNSASRRALYTGVTSNLRKRVWQHKNHVLDGFTDAYNCTRLVFYERFYTVGAAIEREKQIKNWRREKKEMLVSRMNPAWRDLAAGWYGTQGPSTRNSKLAARSG